MDFNRDFKENAVTICGHHDSVFTDTFFEILGKNGYICMNKLYVHSHVRVCSIRRIQKGPTISDIEFSLLRDGVRTTMHGVDIVNSKRADECFLVP